MNGQAERPDDDVVEQTEVTSTDNGNQEAPDGAGSGNREPLSELEALRARADENYDNYLRAAAELDNVRKRAARDVENARRYALERFAKELLAVRDSLEMGIASAENASIESLLEGSAATLKVLGSTMQQFGIEEIDPLGEPFDPENHDAISMQPSDGVEPGSVMTVVQKGYSLNGRLWRPAMVIVASES
ncbi:MAG TPA: nucleotide exchange factor GrpE [Woeseiaceae bacterium]|nr:nucleotide exchange factor GrpE [Woeseiaceae bacterium]